MKIRNMLIYFLGKMVPAIAILFIMIFGVRFLGKSEFGRYSLLFNCINISVTFFAGWIQQSMLRFNTGTHEVLLQQRNQFIRYATMSAFLSAVIIAGLAFYYFDEPILNSLAIGSFVFILTSLAAHLTYLQSRFQSAEYAITESLFYLVTVLLLSLIIFYSFPPKMIYFYCAWLIAGLGWVLAVFFREGRIIVQSIKAVSDTEFFKKTFRFGFLITGWLMISNLFNVADRFIIRHYYNFEDVGIYSVVYDLIYRITGFIAMPLLLTLHPLIMKLWNEDQKEDCLRIIKRAVGILALVMVAELAGYALLGNWLFSTFFHLETSGMMVMMIPLIISSVLWQASLFLHKPLEILFKQRQMIAGILLSLISNVLLNLAFVPRYGMLAAAYSTLASTLVYVLFVLAATGSYKKLTV